MERGRADRVRAEVLDGRGHARYLGLREVGDVDEVRSGQLDRLVGPRQEALVEPAGDAATQGIEDLRRLDLEVARPALTQAGRGHAGQDAQDDRAYGDGDHGLQQRQSLVATHHPSPSGAAFTSPISEIWSSYLPAEVSTTSWSGKASRVSRSTLPGGVKRSMGLAAFTVTSFGTSYSRNTRSESTSTRLSLPADQWSSTVRPRDAAAVAPCQTLCWKVATAPRAAWRCAT